MNKDILFSLWYDSLEGTKSQGFAYKAWCAGWEAAVLAEREACAKLCEEKALYFQYDFIAPYDVADSCAEEIRARSKNNG